MELLLLENRVLARKKPDGTIEERKRYDGKLYVVPQWCRNSLEDHACAWGCMQIMHGYVEEKGRDACKTCEMYSPEDGEIYVLKTPVLNTKDDFDGYTMGLYLFKGENPAKYPVVATFTHTQQKDKFGNHFLSTVEFEYVENSATV